jgi:hypothetical protein
MSRGGCDAQSSVEDSEELAAKAAALKAKQDRAEAAKAAKAAKQKRRKLLGSRWNWLAFAPIYGLVDMHHYLRSVKYSPYTRLLLLI